MSCRTDKGVMISVIDKGFFGKDILLSARPLVGLLYRGNMRLDASIMTDKKILYGPILGVGYYGSNFLLRSVLMGIDHLFEKFTIISRSGSNFGGSNNFVGGIYPSMCLVP
jgi:hypothetical protein